MPFDNRMKNMQTPGRVHALCKFLLLGSYHVDTVKEFVQPNSADKIQANEVMNLAKNGGLITVDKQNFAHLNVPEEDVRDLKRFERYLAVKAFHNTDFIFGRFSAWFITRSEKAMNESKEELAESFFNEVTKKVQLTNEFNTENITAWMTWANYFGLGHTMDGRFIGNPAIRIQRILESDEKLRKGDFIPFKTFMKWLGENCPELDGGKLNLKYNEQIAVQQLSFALSLGLRTLHDLNVITLKNTRDVEDIWYLWDVPTHEITNQVTEIMVKG
ncbi:hypothetical protein [Bacillus sp. X1(2014)]|uniref:hypothetical protein n=1 Tax=Bacillus sp. X1(2014) TaxID=1565991 RepID=UPI0011A57AA9|nr:hypothetical protein [Bacillus sp. X1(2014)]